MKKAITACALAALIAIAPLSSASAHNHWRHGGPILGIAALGAAVVVGTATILAAPFNALAEAPPQGYYPPPAPQAYYAPPPQAYYAPPPVGYYPQPQVVYAAPPRYYAQAPVYYAPRYYR